MNAASVVPYRSFRTSDGDILFGGGTDRLFGLLCEGLGKPEWINDERFAVNSARVANRDPLEPWIEEITMSKTTQEWLEIFDGTGLPYAKVNDLMDTLTHEHGGLCLDAEEATLLTSGSPRSRNGERDRAPDLWTDEVDQHTCQVLVLDAWNTCPTTDTGATY